MTVKKVLIIGSGGLSIGQAGEFDYSGSQAIKALKEEGIETVLINPNIATIQTSKDFADKVYFLPVTEHFVTEIIKKERPDGIFLGFGGQTALNTGITLAQSGVLKEYNIKVLGTSVDSIITAEDKGLFVKALEEINVKTPRSYTIHTIEEGLKAADKIGYPLIVRAGFALGGLGSGFCSDELELTELLQQALTHSTQALVEESLKGWKEVEYEVMRDKDGHAITICNMENFDPLGIHTGESIVIAPSQTLTDSEYQKLRDISLRVVEHLTIVGECNVQFALDPDSEDYRVIEVNPRLSRSSALASKATGYPIAFIAAKVQLGYNLTEIANPVTGITKAFFEPSLDYVVVKYPRWDTEKFMHVKKEIGSSMKSVGEAMAIGRNFEEALQKSVRMIRPQLTGATDSSIDVEDFEKDLEFPTDKRLFAVIKAFKKGYTVDNIYHLTKIDRWFLYKVKNIVDMHNSLKKHNLQTLDSDMLRKAKLLGFSDKEIARLVHGRMDIKAEMIIRELRVKHGILPVTKQIDTLAGEFPCKTNYLYLTYHGVQDDITVKEKGVIVLGSGAYSIGSSVEFDWCCVECVKTVNKSGIPSVVINYNPETVSTDYDESARLYFDELTFERVLDIYQKENPKGVIVSMGGQIANNLALPLHEHGVKILGTKPEVIDRVEDRHKFSSILDELGIDQPDWAMANEISEVTGFCDEVGYPVLVRPSYVLSGAAMNVAYDQEDLERFLKKAVSVSQDHPVVLSKFITGAKEIDMDIVAQDGEIRAYAISEHVENAGVHSGDATLVTPAQKLYLHTITQIKRISRKLIKHLNITGPVNIQFLAKNNEVKIIECNLRASRSFPFVSKVYDTNFIRLATRGILGEQIEAADSKAFDLEYLGVKAPQFSFTRLHGADPLLGVEMASTGEVACLGRDMHEAFLKAWLSSGNRLPKKNILLSTGDVKQKARLVDAVRTLDKKGYKLYASPGTYEFYANLGIETTPLHWPHDEVGPNIKTYLEQKKIDLVINIPKNNEREELSNNYYIRRTAVNYSVPLITNVQVAELFVESLESCPVSEMRVHDWSYYVDNHAPQ